MSSFPTNQLVKKSVVVPFVVCVVLALFVAASALPRYASSWPWTTPPKVANQSALQSIRDRGITLPNWSNEEQLRRKIGSADWSIQQLSQTKASATEPNTAFLLLRPQIWEADQPEVEWVDIKGSQQWKTDSHKKLPFVVSADQSLSPALSQPLAVETVQIKPDFFRAWNLDQTYAVLQWYAWQSGGSASVAQWFWADQQMQWQHHQRMPWVAVSLWLPVEPLGNIAPYQTLAKTLGEEVHTTLLQTVFSGKQS